ncbi:MAG: flagellin [Paracoccaceae bacterium]
MSLTINNDSAIGFALIALNRSSNLMNEAMERLSTGKRINKASDDPAGIHRVMRLNAEIQGIKTASRNAADGQSLIDTLDASLSEVQAIVLRMRELTVQAISDTNSPSDRAALDLEISQLELEITRIGATTSFGGKPIFDGNTHYLQIGPRSGNTLEVQAYTLSASTLGLNQDLTARTNAENYLGIIDNAIADINEKRSAAGALSNQLDFITSSLDNNKVNLIKSRSNIEDADFAAESVKLAKATILEQVAIAMIAQANVRTNWILKLLEK